MATELMNDPLLLTNGYNRNSHQPGNHGLQP